MIEMPETFPAQAWVLTPGFQPKEVTLTEASSGWRSKGCRTETKWMILLADLYATKGDAIAGGRERLIEQQARIDAMQAKLEKRKATLEKAAAKL
ncbi:MAG: hypothetical protein GAK30_02974 [Paracidovorax wautersii]|uniref:Uncharacterized protein n=1 Tax=Paracidovorax wautersii TaxID=1177982 RepID=A0A7V8FM11_9BURK|nr:MAG: hypothetical protein GAK30_02974 [Paracidovorax wautersii]